MPLAVAPERLWKWGGTGPERKWEKIWSCLFTFWF